MVKAKEIKTKKSTVKAKITVKNIMVDAKRFLYKKKCLAIQEILETKYKELESAETVVKKIKKQLKTIENMDINDIDVDDFKYKEE